MAGENLLKKAADWDSLATGLEAVDGAIRLQVGKGVAWGAVIEDTVPSSASPAWSDFVSGGGSISVINGEILFNSPSSGQTAFSNLPRATWPGNPSGYIFATGLTIYMKRVGLNPTTNAGLEIDDGAKRLTITQVANGWNTVSPSVSDDSNHDEFLFSFIADKVTMFSRFSGGDGLWVLQINDQPMAAGGNERILIGDTSGASSPVQRALMDFFRARTGAAVTPFLNTSPVSTMGAVALPQGFIINGLGDFRTSITGSGTLKAAYNINDAGWSGLFDDIEALNAFLLANPITITDAVNSVDLRMTHGSNGLEQVQFWPGEGPNLTSAIVCDFPNESDVRLNVDYDSGNLTGSAAIPGPSDVRDGVAVDDTTGSAAIPGENDVREGVAVDDTTGTYEPADEENVRLNVQYGANSTEFTGELDPVTLALPLEIIEIEGLEVIKL